MGQGTNASRYILEIDGVTSLIASEVTMPDMEHTVTELHVGNEANPRLLRGNFKIGELTFKHATAVNESGRELMAWIQDFVQGTDVTRRTVRFIVMDESGLTPVDEYELQDCVPTRFKPETHNASSNEASMFTFGLRAANMVML
jgi:phage tail-like protein